jgi:hypothetical protein
MLTRHKCCCILRQISGYNRNLLSLAIFNLVSAQKGKNTAKFFLQNAAQVK